MGPTDDVRPPDAARARGEVRPRSTRGRRVGISTAAGGFLVALSPKALEQFETLCAANGAATPSEQADEIRLALERGLDDRACELTERSVVLTFPGEAATILERLAAAGGLAFGDMCVELYNRGMWAAVAELKARGAS